jgi:hypothetical protein
LYSTEFYNPETPRANAVSSESNNAMTPTRTTFRTSSTARISADRAPVSGFRKTSKPASPKMATAAVTVAKISTIIRASSAPTATSWRFSLGWESTSKLLSTKRFVEVVLAGGSNLISLVVAVTAAVMRLI